MYAQIRLFSGYKKPLWYQIPPHIQIELGSIVHVPLQKRAVYGLVTAIQAYCPVLVKEFALKSIMSKEVLPQDPHYFTFLEQLAYRYNIETLPLLERIQHFLHQKEEKTLILTPGITTDTQTPLLTDEQQAVCNFITPHIIQPCYIPVLLHGITGSGKTEIYKHLIIEAINQNKSVFFLLPEVSLALAFERRLKKELPSFITSMGFHSGKTVKEKQLLWQLLLQQKPVLIIGVHLPVLLPMSNLGLIIVDEEHETGYREKKHPKINSAHAAVMRAALYNIPIILGSATPSLPSLYAAKQKKLYFFQLTKRFGGTLPQIQLVSLLSKHKKNSFWISKELEEAIANRLAKKEQIIIFLNRRGYSFFVQCKGCGFIFTCTHCSVSLTLHSNNQLTCHYCTQCMILPTICPKCKDVKAELLKKGIGTQQALAILQELFPTARIARADVDTTTKKKVWQKTIADFEAGSIDILVGTQTVTKGYHFPKVTLVGIIWADLNLHFPVFNATEVALQQLIQVAGRAGRASTESLVIVQTLHDHDIFQFIDETTYLQFYKQEIAIRKKTNYPPCNTLLEIELKHTNEAIIEKEAQELADFLYITAKDYPNIRILGPAKPIVHKIKNMHMRMIYIKAENLPTVLTLVQKIDITLLKSSIHCTPQ